jgi:predicted dienelactone hydrolase
MIPAYALVAIVVMRMVWGILRMTESQNEPPSRGRRIVTIIGVVLGLLALVVAAAFPFMLPLFSLPEPTGAFAVGTQYFYWADEERPDEFTTDPGDFREVSVQVWYPADLSGDEKLIPYMNQEAARAMARSWEAPEFMLDHLALVSTHAYLGPDVAQTGTPLPVITYSTSGLMSSHMALFEELASQGYVVLCIGHPYWNPYVYGSGGEVLPFDGQIKYYQEWWDEDEAVDEARSEIVFAKNTPAQERAHRRHNDVRPLAVRDLRVWAENVGFVLDKLEIMNQGSGFMAKALDLERVGIMGFSKGGATAGQFCLIDERCQAGINLTGMMYGDIVEANLDNPFIFMSEEGPSCPDCYVNDLFYKRAESDAYQMKIMGARHTNFGDPCLWGELLMSSEDNPEIECQRMIDIQNVYTLTFFDKYLKGIASPLLDGPSPDYPEVVFKSHHP